MIRIKAFENQYAVTLEAVSNDPKLIKRIREMVVSEFKQFVKRVDNLGTDAFKILFDKEADAHACLIRPTAERMRGIAAGITWVEDGTLKHYSEE